jgi:quercetin dioxygenase-like cupin family protein
MSRKKREMKNTKHLLSTALASTILFGMASFQSADAGEEYVPKVQGKTLHKAPLPGVEGKEMVVKHFAIPAKYVGGKHIHPGPVFVYVLEGELTVELESETKTFKAGELYPEDINAAMVGKNLSATDDLEILVFQVGDIGKPMMIKVK